jgi:Cu+-exporting ATPase
MDLDDGRVVFDDPPLETGAVATDPVCGMKLERADAAAAVDHHGVIYYFCSPACKARFVAAPDRFITSAPSP